MRSRLLVACLTALPLFAACAADGDEGPSPYDDDAPVQAGDINEGAPANSSLPDDNKSDAQYPAKFELGDQSSVKSQGSRGVCSIFAATAQIENLYIKAGMPAAEADFSEQYLQWGAKNLPGGSFQWTDGSTSDVNLRVTPELAVTGSQARGFPDAFLCHTGICLQNYVRSGCVTSVKPEIFGGSQAECSGVVLARGATQ
jgi:hypothetical protein